MGQGTSENAPRLIALWLARRDEHALAASLGLCPPDFTVCEQMVRGAAEEIESAHPGVRVRIGRWHVWRVVRAMHRAGMLNTPQGRAAAFAMLAGSDDEA